MLCQFLLYNEANQLVSPLPLGPPSQPAPSHPSRPSQSTELSFPLAVFVCLSASMYLRACVYLCMVCVYVTCVYGIYVYLAGGGGECTFNPRLVLFLLEPSPAQHLPLLSTCLFEGDVSYFYSQHSDNFESRGNTRERIHSLRVMFQRVLPGAAAEAGLWSPGPCHTLGDLSIPSCTARPSEPPAREPHP